MLGAAVLLHLQREPGPLLTFSPCSSMLMSASVPAPRTSLQPQADGSVHTAQTQTRFLRKCSSSSCVQSRTLGRCAEERHVLAAQAQCIVGKAAHLVYTTTSYCRGFSSMDACTTAGKHMTALVTIVRALQQPVFQHSSCRGTRHASVAQAAKRDTQSQPKHQP